MALNYTETQQSKTLKAIDRFGREASIKTIAKLISSTRLKAKDYLRHLYKKGLVKRRKEYIHNLGKTYPVSYYRLNEDNLKNVKFWLEHY